MTSRLERLFVLLESGSSGVTRRAAAQQLGEVQRLRPHELHRLLARVYCYLRSPAWETRIAAGQAIEAILKNVPQWDPPASEAGKDEKIVESEAFETGRLRFDTFDIEKVLAQGAHLMGSEGKEYDLEDDSILGMDMREKLARQRQLLNARLGLDMASKLGMDMSDIFSNEDLMYQASPAPSTPVSGPNPPLKLFIKKPVSELVSAGVQLSSREMNRARRKARQQRGTPGEDGGCSPALEPDRKRFKTDTEETAPVFGEWVPDVDGSWGPEVLWWPLEGWAGALAGELFSAQWEARHGAATALRDLLKCQGKGAGRERGASIKQMEDMHQCWLEDISLRLLCVLALDRFGDFVSDQVVAPVRETCAQCLGIAASLMGPPGTAKVSSALSLLARQPHWEARHGALLGLKYLIAIQQELGQETAAFPSVVRALWDPVDDVAAGAAAALAPGARSLVLAAPAALPAVVGRLRRLLAGQDELAAACGCYMALLAALLAEPEINDLLGPKYLASVVPRLWPYLSHPTSSVRRAALQTLRTLTRCPVVIAVADHHQLSEEIKTELDTKAELVIKAEHDNNEIKPKNGGLKPELERNHSEVEMNNSGIEKRDAELKKVMAVSCHRIKDKCKMLHDVKLYDSSGAMICVNWLQDLVHEVVEDGEESGWSSQLLQDALRHVFQRVLVEHIQDIQAVAEEVWNNLVKSSCLELLLHAACPYVSTWLCLTMQPAKIPFDPIQLIQSKPLLADKAIQEALASAGQGLSDEVALTDNGLSLAQRWYVGGSETTSLAVREGNVTRARCIAARMLGLLSCYIIRPAPNIIYTSEIDSPVNCYIKVVLVYLSSKSALQRLVVGLVVSGWARLDPAVRPAPPDLVSKLHHCLTMPIYFDEIAVTCTRILQETRDFLAMLRHYNITPENEENQNINSLDQVVQICRIEGLITKSKMKKNKISQSLEDRRKSILASALQCSKEQNTLNVSTLAALAGACANLHALPEKLNPVIKPLMESIKKEENEQLQKISADNLAELLKQCVCRLPCPNVKVLSNLCMFLRSDVEFSPKIDDKTNGDLQDGKSDQLRDSSRYGILTLFSQQRQAERAVLKRSASIVSTSGAPNSCLTPGPSGRGPGRPPATDIPLEELFPTEDETQKQCRIQRRGATFALISLTTDFGEELPEKLPKLWEIIMLSFSPDPCQNAEELITALQVLEVVAPYVAKSLLPQLLQHLEGLTTLLDHQYKATRHMAARCLATLAHIASPKVMMVVVEKILPMLGAIEHDQRRQGAAEALACIVDKLQINIVPYIVLLVVPLLGRMSDHDEPVRLMSTHCFATLIQLMPLDGAVREPEGLPRELLLQRARDRGFLEQLFNPKAIGDYKVPVEVQAELRSYQQAGVNWLAFLNKYKLHGVLCDDMGLGKTLQSICIVAGDHHQRQLRPRDAAGPPLPSLVICPPTLTGHWVYEVRKFLESKYLNPLHYTGPPFERERLRTKVRHHNLIVASYDIVRKDIDFFTSIKWNYCILDEGHFIKNGKTKASKAIKMLVANHRLILSGTPIQRGAVDETEMTREEIARAIHTETQGKRSKVCAAEKAKRLKNNVLELWSLFDFLMPGLLGTERQFTARYSRPILAARDPKATPQHQEAGALAMEALHRQVLPFLLRRMKEDVLTELPPKITQDYYCELSPLQRRLYEDFSRVHMPHGLPQGHQHVFQALRYLQNVCNHPKLVLTPQHPEYASVIQELAQQHSSLDDIQHSAKLPALKQLLLDCGIGCPPSDTSTVLSQHRALVFCQLKGMLDVVERDLLRPLLPHVSYLRLDGSVPPGQRHSLVQRFNNDPSIDVLLLTTQVGGLGLNLTGADTVIFVEHDWNPMKDLQAMDRAHRIGQKKVVNVYRLITRATLEEKIMGLQKFKLLTASTIISSENASLETMGTDQLLDLFHLDNKGIRPSSSSSDPDGPATMKTILENLPDLWDDQQYETEYDMANFVKNLGKN